MAFGEYRLHCLLGWVKSKHALTSCMASTVVSSDTACSIHYYKNVDLSRLGNRCCPGFPTGNACPGQKGVPFCPGCGNRDKRSLFFHVFLFSILFLFQLYFCISIKLMYWNSVCMISTNIYIYIKLLI